MIEIQVDKINLTPVFTGYSVVVLQPCLSSDVSTRGVTWVNFCWVCAAGLSETLPH